MYSDVTQTLEHLFPELAESEDERIRKELIEFVKSRGGFKQEYIVWLAKQGEHANFRNKIQIGDKVTRNEDGVLVNLSQLNRVAKKDEKQGEHKLAEWSEEDEWCLEQINFLIRNSYSADDKVERLSNWVKFIKDRVQSQPKQEWSEEDYNEIETIACHLDNINNEGMAEALRSIRDKYYLQPTWKPSEEMLEALYRVIPENTMEISEDEMLLDKLYQGLKYGRVLSKK